MHVGKTPALLKRSIASSGIIEPPLLLSEKSNSGFQILCGFRRIRELIETGAGSLYALLIDPSDFKRTDLFEVAVCSNLLSGGMNAAEKALVITALSGKYHVSARKIADYWMPLLSLPASSREIIKYTTIAQNEQEILESLAEGTINSSTAFLLAQFDAESRGRFFSIISNLRMGTNYQKQFLSLISEIAEREKHDACKGSRFSGGFFSLP